MEHRHINIKDNEWGVAIVHSIWEQWEKLLEAAANIQGLFPGSVMIGGSAAAIHLQHRYSFDADHIPSNLKENLEEFQR